MTTSAAYLRVVEECREALRTGGDLRGLSLMRVIDVVQHAANTLDSQGAATGVTTNTAADALEALLITEAAAVVTENTDADALEVLLVTLAAAVADVNTKADALEALIVTTFVNWNAVGAGDSSAVYTAELAAQATPRTDLIASVTAAVAAKDACTTPRATLVTSTTALVAAKDACVTPRATLVTAANASVLASTATIDNIATHPLDGRIT